MLFQPVTKQQIYVIVAEMNKLLKHLKISVFILMYLQFAKAQNLISDSSFEHNKYIPVILSSIGANNSWSAPTMGTTDLFCECGKKDKESSEAQVPQNPFGTQKANTGKCYAGIYAFSHGDYREYLLTQLSMPMEAGLKYELYMYLSLADYSRVTIEQIGACFLRSKPTFTSSNVIQGLKPIYAKISEEVGSDTVNWHQIIIEYKAKGGEQFLLIGSFDVDDIYPTNVKAPKNVRTKINQRTERDAYYYIDDVSLREVHPPYVAKFDTIVVAKIDTIKPTIFNATDSAVGEIALDKSLILKNVLFETGKAVLLPPSYPELDSIIKYLNNKPLLKIEITGHTDNVGNEITNTTLSEKRAQAVADYLVSKRIEPTRITTKGFGSQKPITTNDTEEGRKLNRRVEFMFVR